MKHFGNNDTIVVDGVAFNGVDDIIVHARAQEPKDGLWVADDAQRYPCFDSSDSLYEKRYFHNFVFARSKDELDEKLSRLKAMDCWGGNYFKLTEELHPMAYWQGDVYFTVQVTDGEVERADAFIHNDKDKARCLPPDYRLPVLKKDDDFERERVLLTGLEKKWLMRKVHDMVEQAKEMLKTVPEKGWFSKPYRVVVHNDPGVFIVNCKFMIEVWPYENYLEGRDTMFDDYRTLRTAAVADIGPWSTTGLCTAASNEGIREFLEHFFIDFEISESLWKNYLSVYPELLTISE